jgi:fimbrial chaperone protein
MNALKQLIYMIITAFISVVSVQAGWAASFSVAPVRVILDAQHRTERLSVKNESERPLTLLIKAYRWTQTNEGMDRYDETADLIIFPRVLSLSAEEERFIRVGIANPSGPVEQAFRIYLEEQPVKDEQVTEGATGRILMRVGIPVFAQPRKLETALKIGELHVAQGRLRFSLSNGGNSFVMAGQITIKGLDDKTAELFVSNLGGFYLLAGSTRPFDVAIPEDQCGRVARISVTTRNEGREQHNELNMPLKACEGT